MASPVYLIGYLVFTCGIVYILTMGQTDFHRNGVVGWLNVFIQALPQTVLRATLTVLCCSKRKGVEASRKIEYSLCKVRHPLMQWMYLALIGSAVVVFFLRVYPMFIPWLAPGITIHHLLAPLAVLAAAWSFVAACWSDPGTVTKENVAKCQSVYSYDESLFFKDNVCPTCDLPKPPR
eukprot:Sspe_Gene.32338::Locus_15855_Transcript_1_1_Confidence_1.000_Length_2975::g.32338::m.32338